MVNLLPGRKPTSSPADDALLKRALKQLASAEKHAEEINRLKDRAQKVYLGRTNPDYGKTRDPHNKRDWRSRLFPQVAKEHAELKIAELCDSTPEWDAKPRLQRDYDLATGWERAVSTYLDLDEFPQTFRTGMRRCVKYGDQPVKVIMTKDYGADTPRPTIIPLDYKDFLPEPSARKCCDASWVWHRWRATLNDLKAARDDNGDPLYKNLEDLEPNPGGDSNDQRRPNETQEQFEARQTGLHTLYERWSPWGVLVIANKTTIIRHDEDYDDPIFEDQRVPFEVVRIIEDDDNLGGANVSTMLGLEHEQEAYWKFYNELVNAITLATRPPKLVDEELDPNAATYATLYPDQVMPARNGEQTVKILQDIANLSGYGMQQLIQMARDHMERSSGMNAAVAGLSNANSATESSSNLAQSKSRTRLEIQQSDDDWGRVIAMFASRIRQYCDPAEVLEFTGGIDIKSAPFRGRFVSKLSSERALREQRMNNLTTFWNALMPMVPPGSIEFNYLYKLLKQMEEAYDVGDLGATSKTQQQVVQEQQSQQLQLERAQQQIQMEGQQQQAMLEQQIAAAQPQPVEQAPPVEPEAPIHESLSMNYKDAPPSVQRQMEALAGFQPATAAEGRAQLESLKPRPVSKPGEKNSGSKS